MILGMTILEFLAPLSVLLPSLPSFLRTPVGPLVKSLISEQHGQINCLEHNFLDLDIVRRHEAAIFVYPEIRVGCETISVKPFQPPSKPSPEFDHMSALFNRTDKRNMKRPPKRHELPEKVHRYFVIDMHGNETQIRPGSSVTVATYDLNTEDPYDLKLDAYETMAYWSCRHRHMTKLQTFYFEQLCFPVECYEPWHEVGEECISDSQWLSAEEAGSITSECAKNPYACPYNTWKFSTLRRKLYGKSGATLASNITTYCSLETSNGPRLGPLRNSGYMGLQALLSNRSQVPSDTFKHPNDQYMRKSDLRTSALLSRHIRTWMYKDVLFITSCIVTVPVVEPPYNTGFAVDFFVQLYLNEVQKLIRPGDRFEFGALVNELTLYGSSFRLEDAEQEMKFEDLCFPAECFKERTPAEVARCQLQEPETSKYQVPGTALYYEGPSSGVQKLLWPTVAYDNKFFSVRSFVEYLGMPMREECSLQI